jgi:hypothetical protein
MLIISLSSVEPQSTPHRIPKQCESAWRGAGFFTLKLCEGQPAGFGCSKLKPLCKKDIAAAPLRPVAVICK